MRRPAQGVDPHGGLAVLRAAVLAAMGPAAPGWLCTETAGVEGSPVGSLAGPRHRESAGRGSSGSGPTEVTAGDDETERSRLVALVELARDGDAEAFGALYDHYVATVYRFLYYRVGTRPLAEDLTSETFLRAMRAMPSFQWQGRDFGAWLVTIARNLVADHYKSGRYRLELSTDEIVEQDASTVTPEDEVLTGLTNRALVDALRELPGEQQECLVLRFLHEMSIAETAAVMGRSEGAIKQLQLRGVRSLAKRLPGSLR